MTRKTFTGTKWSNHPIQIPDHRPVLKPGEPMEFLGESFCRPIVGTPVTLDGTVIGKVINLTGDGVQVEIAKEHLALVQRKLDGLRKPGAP